LVFTLYLLPGVTNTSYANLKWISGFPPPLHYSIYKKNNTNHKGVEANVINNYEAALLLAKQQHKPLLIDFTGWACTNCRKMEEQIWTNKSVEDYITQNFILVSLYVDDKAKLPIENRFVYTNKIGKKDIETIGDTWATFQSENFVQVSQPLYAIINTNEQLINFPIGYTPNASQYLQWLQCGTANFK
jgi:thiol:disulfide interchange protein DsbD